MADGFQRGDAVLFVRNETVHMIDHPNTQLVSATVGVVTSVTRDGKIKAYRSGYRGESVRLRRRSIEYGADLYRLRKDSWDIDAIVAYCADRPWAHAPQHRGAPFNVLEQARAELGQFRREVAV
jgi:hypothetical protein